jgi:hypothetical protein
MKKVFYNPTTLQIIGLSDGDNSFDFPYIETQANLINTLAVELKKNKQGEVTLHIDYEKIALLGASPVQKTQEETQI